MQSLTAMSTVVRYEKNHHFRGDVRCVGVELTLDAEVASNDGCEERRREPIQLSQQKLVHDQDFGGEGGRSKLIRHETLVSATCHSGLDICLSFGCF